MVINWNEVLFNSDDNLLERLDSIAKKRFWDENLALEAVNEILKKLHTNNWACLKNYEAKNDAKPSTYLYRIFFNSLEDFSKKKFGYHQPKTWLRKKGSFWIMIWKQLHSKRESHEQIISSYGNGDKQRESEIRNIIIEIKAKEPNCGKRDLLTSIGGTKGEECYEFDEEVPEYSQPYRSINETLQAENLEGLLIKIGQLIELEPQSIMDKNIPHKIEHYASLVEINHIEKLILTMKHYDNMNISQISQVLKIKDKKMTPYKVKNILDNVQYHLNRSFREADIDINELFNL